jgi:hypothetical protein
MLEGLGDSPVPYVCPACGRKMLTSPMSADLRMAASLYVLDISQEEAA